MNRLRHWQAIPAEENDRIETVLLAHLDEDEAMTALQVMMEHTVPASTYQGAVEACLAQWVVAHRVKCCCEDPDTAGCEWPVPIPHTQAALDAAIERTS
jgi:hypothetical protein